MRRMQIWRWIPMVVLLAIGSGQANSPAKSCRTGDPGADAAPRPSIPGDFSLTFSDEFEGTQLDESRWTVGYHFNAIINRERQHYVPENVILEGDGLLKFKIEKRPVHQAPPRLEVTQQYASGQIETWDKWSQTYGLFEARIRMPKAKGLWPAFWLMPDRGPEEPADQRMSTYDGGMEIDIMEHLTVWGDYMHAGVIWDGYRQDKKSHNAGGPESERHRVPSISDDFHTYACYWEPGRILFFVDGRVIDGYEGERVASVPMHIILNCAVGGQWPEGLGPIDDAALPDWMEVDWVRVYRGTIDPAFRVPNLDSFPFPAGEAHRIPGRVEAEHFDYGRRGVAWYDKDDWSQGTYRKDQKGVDAEPTHLFNLEWNEWLSYTVEVPETAAYSIRVQAKSPQRTEFKILVGDSSEPVAVIARNFGLDKWSQASVSGVVLPQGEQRIRVLIGGQRDIQLDWIEFERDPP